MGENESETPCCGTCRFWRGTGDLGWCHRNPPVVNVAVLKANAREEAKNDGRDGDYIQSLLSLANEPFCWSNPATHRHHWCGEYQPKQS